VSANDAQREARINQHPKERQMKYGDAVKEARTLVKRSDGDQWRLAQLTWEQVEAGKTRNGWASDIGISGSHASRLYQVWTKWRNRATRPTFSDAIDELMGGSAGDRLKAMGAREATAEMFRELPAARQATLVHEVARANPEILRPAVRDPRVYAAISKERISHVVEEADRSQGRPTVSREEFGRSMREAKESDALLALYRAQEALAIAMRFSAHTIAEDCSEKDVRNLKSSLPNDIEFLQSILDAVSSEKLRVVRAKA